VKYVVLGLLVGLCLAFPALAALVVAAGHWLAAQPLLWAFCAGIVARPHLARRFDAPTRRNTR
jgi:hypothetical protein